MNQTDPTSPYRYIDGDDFCLSARLLPDLNAGGVTETLSITIEGSDEPQSVHVQAADVPAVAAGIMSAARQQPTAAMLSVAERQFLTFALDLAADEMASRGDEFSDEDDDALASLRRLAAEAQQQTETEARPQRGDQVEAWLKTQRDAAADYPEAYQAADRLLDLYRLHADTGTPLGEHVCEGRMVGDCECREAAPVAQQPAAEGEEVADRG